jgi:hypothetical protein
VEPGAEGVVELDEAKSVSQFIKLAKTGRIWQREPSVRSPG